MEGEGKQKLVFLCPSRGLIGFRSAFATLTRGSGLMHRAFVEYGAFRGVADRVRKGVLVSMAGEGAVPSSRNLPPCVSEGPAMYAANTRAHKALRISYLIPNFHSNFRTRSSIIYKIQLAGSPLTPPGEAQRQA